MELMLSMDEAELRTLIVALGYGAGTLTRLEHELNAVAETPLMPMARRLIAHAHALTTTPDETRLLAHAVHAGESDVPFLGLPVDDEDGQ